jgi:DNA/RNA-binding domain of Phe-tRNA-synthetase-like protein
MKFKVEREIFERFKGLSIGVVIVKGADNSGSDGEILKSIREQEKRIRESYDTWTLSAEPKIAAWRNAYSAFGGKPGKNKVSVESLYRTVLNGNLLRHINQLVDIYSLVSLKHMLPAGGEDLDKIEGDIILTFAVADEKPVLVLGDSEPRAPHEGEVIYKDGVSTICRRWNWREADRTKLTEGTNNCILVIEGLPPVTKEEIESATKELKELVERFCGGSVTHDVLDESGNEIEFRNPKRI